MKEAVSAIPALVEILNPPLKTSCVYAIKNLIDSKVYIGSASRCVIFRWNLHKSQLRRGIHHSIFLQRAWDKHGEQSFQFAVIKECDPKECLSVEQVLMDHFKSYDNQFGYNMNPMASSSLGIKRRPETVLKIGLSKKGKKHTQEHIEKVRASKIGVKFTESHKENIRSVRLAAPKRSLETRLKIGAASKGRKHSEESRRRISEGTKAGLSSREARDKISTRSKEHWRTEGYRKKVIEGIKNAALNASEEQKAKVAQKTSERWKDPEYKRVVGAKISEGKNRFHAKQRLIAASNMVSPPTQNPFP